MSFLTALLTFLVVLSVLVFAHELGHFVTAKRAGIKVQEFGFGYPPRLFGVRFGETLYSVNLLPLGGFVKMLGENAEPGDPQAFSSKSKRVRATVLIAGSAMNLLLAPIFFSASLMIGEPVPEHVAIARVEPGSPAESAGMLPGDIFVSLNGRAIHEALTLRDTVRSNVGREIEVVVRRDGREVPLRIVPRQVTQEGQGALGIQLQQAFRTLQRPIWEAVPMGIQRTGEVLVLFAQGIKQMVVREIPVELAGPIGIAQMTDQAAQAGINYLLQFTAFLSLNLAIFNLLPIPGLDGARVAFVVLEGIRGGRRLNPQIEGAIHFIGLMLLITLMLFVSFKDVQRLVPG
ncbi:MAG TPA: RIP metalloprotease RseP [Chloroflexota bacterium]|nr:RIP metalloprotease RseP [Chloroflexota bacterium]